MKDRRPTRLPAARTAGLIAACLLLAVGAASAREGREVPHPPAPTGRIVAGGGDGYEPYHYLADGEPTGFDVELLQAVAAAMGMQVDVRLGPWADVRSGLEDGVIDVHVGLSHSPARGRSYDFTAPTLSKQSRIFVRRGDRTILGEADLRGRRIVVQRDGIMIDYVRQRGYTDQPLLADSAEEALRMVATGRADCCLMSEFRGLHVLQQAGIDDVVRVGAPVAQSNYGFAVRPGRRDILLRLNLGLALVEKSGEYDRIYAKWFGILDPQHLSLWDYARYAGRVIVPLLVVLALAFFWSWSLRRQVVRRTAELRQARDQAEAASEAKSRFLTTVGHEIRTPLNGVLGMTSLLQASPLDDQQQEQVAVITRSALALQETINDVLEISEFAAGRRRLQPAEFELPALVADAVEDAAPAARAKGLDLRLEFDPGLPARVLGDGPALGKVLRHLLDNAVKFTAAGHVELRLGGTMLTDGRIRLEGAVTDTGIGVAAADRGQIFDPFTQVDSSSTRRYGGTGLGLAICRNLLDLMEGGVEVADGPDGGAVFAFTAVVAPATVFVATVPDDGTCAPNHLILVVEDNPTNQRVISLLLRKWGYEFETAENGLLAVEACRENTFGAILMDCQMPVMDGLEATRAIRELEGRQHHTPIIAVTAGAFGSDRDRCLAAGMDDYLTKPINAVQLKKALQMWLAVGEGIRV